MGNGGTTSTVREKWVETGQKRRKWDETPIFQTHFALCPEAKEFGIHMSGGKMGGNKVSAGIRQTRYFQGLSSA
jgi:hypothetical protein